MSKLNSKDKTNSKVRLDAMLKRSVVEEEKCRQVKREAQHEHWMRVMKEGQSTPDLSYQKS